jgi:hypothetical protein
MWVLKRYPFLNRTSDSGVQVGWYGILICAVSHEIYCNTHSHPGSSARRLVAPTSGRVLKRVVLNHKKKCTAVLINTQTNERGEQRL